MAGKIIKIISEHKRICAKPLSQYRKPQPLQQGYKRIEAIVLIDDKPQTRHVDVKG